MSKRAHEDTVVEERVLSNTWTKEVDERGDQIITSVKTSAVGDFVVTSIYTSSMRRSELTSTAQVTRNGEKITISLQGRYKLDSNSVEKLEEAFQVAMFMHKNNICTPPEYKNFTQEQSIDLLRAIYAGEIGSAVSVKGGAELHHRIVSEDEWRRVSVLKIEPA